MKRFAMVAMMAWALVGVTRGQEPAGAGLFAFGVQITGPAGIPGIGVSPTTPFYEQLPDRKLQLNFDMRFQNNTGGPVIFDEGTVILKFDDGRAPIERPLPFELFVENIFPPEAVTPGAILLEDADVVLFYPFMDLFTAETAPDSIRVELEFVGETQLLIFDNIRPVRFVATTIPFLFPHGAPRVAGTQYGVRSHELNHHHRKAGGINFAGDFVNSQRFAYDIALAKDGSTHEGSGFTNFQYYIFDQPILAMAGGVVTSMKQLVPDQAPGFNNIPAGCEGELSGLLPCFVNFIVVMHDDGLTWAVYLHLRQDSIPSDVVVGGRVEAGQEIGRVGNNGWSTEPHLHVHMSDVRGEGVPLAFSNARFSPQSRLQLRATVPSDSFVSPDLGRIPLLAPEPVGAGELDEIEPNHRFIGAMEVEPDALIHGDVLASDASPEVAVSGDPIEDIYRVTITEPGTLSVDLTADNDLDVYILTRDRVILNPPGEGDTPSQIERLVEEVVPGDYFILVTQRAKTFLTRTNYDLFIDFRSVFDFDAIRSKLDALEHFGLLDDFANWVLHNRLEDAEDDLQEGRIDFAIHGLQDFIEEVQDQVDRGRMDPSVAPECIAAAQKMIDILCPQEALGLVLDLLIGLDLAELAGDVSSRTARRLRRKLVRARDSLNRCRVDSASRRLESFIRSTNSEADRGRIDPDLADAFVAAAGEIIALLTFN